MNTIARTLILAAALLAASAAAQAITYNFAGIADSGPLAGSNFSGQFSFDAATAPADGDALLSGFSMGFAGSSYSLASATGAAPSAVFSGGSFVGLSYLDNSAADPATRPHVAFVPGFFGLADAYLAYAGAAAAGGFGSYAVSVVPEPGAALLLLAGLGALALVKRVRDTR